jgi:hypothetical protein
MEHDDPIPTGDVDVERYYKCVCSLSSLVSVAVAVLFLLPSRLCECEG